jgi:hypothetical protein
MMTYSPFRLLLGSLALVCLLVSMQPAQSRTSRVPADDFAESVVPLFRKYCLECHSTAAKKGSLDLERLKTLADIRKETKLLQNMIEQIETGEMPPKKKPQLSKDQQHQLLTWIRTFLDTEARARTGDPGAVPLRRLSNTEYDNTIRDLTGVDLKPTREFPPDGAAGEGFTNAAEALTDISPTLLTKYLGAAKEVAEHVVLLPQGVRFSPSKTRRDWTDEGTARLKRFYAEVAPPDGKLHVQPYLHATVKYRDELLSGKTTLAKVATTEKLNSRYLTAIWQTLTDSTPMLLVDDLRSMWKRAGVNDVPALAAVIAQWQTALWKEVKIGNYVQQVGSGFTESLNRQSPVDPGAVETLPLRLAVKPAPGQNEVILHLAARDLFPASTDSKVIWQRPRFEASGQPPLLLKDYLKYGDGYVVNYQAVFSHTDRYLQAVVEARAGKSLVELAKQHQLDVAYLKRWAEVLAPDAENLGRVVPVVKLEALTEKLERAGGKLWINGWKKKGQELPIIVTNSSDTAEHIPGNSLPHSVTVHPTPGEFVAVAWKSPVSGQVSVSSRITSAHPVCGNGVAWWLELRHEHQAFLFAEGANALGKTSNIEGKKLNVAVGDQIILAVDARNNDHGCDLTDIDLTITEIGGSKRSWKLAKDVADTIHAGNPHADGHGHRETWTFVCGPTRAVRTKPVVAIPPGSVLHQWREALGNPARQSEVTKLAQQTMKLLAGPRPTDEKDPNRLLYDNLVALEGVLFQGKPPVSLNAWGGNRPTFGLAVERFAGEDVVADTDSVLEVHLPAPLLAGREFVVEAKLAKPDPKRVVQFQTLTTPPIVTTWDGKSTLVADAKGEGYMRLLHSFRQVRELFPLFVCFPGVIANDEVVSLKMFHREDEPLRKHFLDAGQARQLDALWEEHRYVSRQAEAEYAYLPQFIGFVSQDGAPGMLEYFQGQRPNFQKRAEAFAKEERASEPSHIEAVVDFAARAFRRPLTLPEQKELRDLYTTLRSKNTSHLEAIRGMLTRILVSPSFLFRAEAAPVGKEPGNINDWELATRLSYFLWSSPPDAELRRLAASGTLHSTDVLQGQLLRMLKDPRIRSLAIDFGTQWIHIRGFDELKEKNEKLFPQFDARLKQAIYEETILFFQDLFQNNRQVTDLLDSDATYLNDTLAKHYGIPNVVGPEWRRVAGIKKFGRGGLLGLASVQTRQAGASRTSPVLRGNWVVETLLGEKLPKPPPNVPKLPEEEGMDKLTMRQLVENHTRLAECAGCHQRIDPFGFALEKYDPIGRRREKDLGGLPVDAKATLKDGTTFDDIDGLRNYLLTRKKDVIIRLFCQRLLGYALGRATMLSDTVLLDQMVAALKSSDNRIEAVLHVIIASPQFRMIRGSNYTD